MHAGGGLKVMYEMYCFYFYHCIMLLQSIEVQSELSIRRQRTSIISVSPVCFLYEEMMGQCDILKGYTKSCSVIIFHRFIDVCRGFVVVRNNKHT